MEWLQGTNLRDNQKDSNIYSVTSILNIGIQIAGALNYAHNEIIFQGSPKEQFYFSNLSGGKNVDAGWELINLEHKIGIRETGSFHTNKVNLWGWKHLISPELFINISIKPGETTEWSRTYKVYRKP